MRATTRAFGAALTPADLRCPECSLPVDAEYNCSRCVCTCEDDDDTCAIHGPGPAVPAGDLMARLRTVLGMGESS